MSKFEGRSWEGDVVFGGQRLVGNRITGSQLSANGFSGRLSIPIVVVIAGGDALVTEGGDAFVAEGGAAFVTEG